MAKILERILVGRRFKLQALLFAVLACCLGVFIHGLINYTDAPYKPCAGGHYCGKKGQLHSYETYRQWKRWEAILVACWPFGIAASYGLSRLRKVPD